MFKVKSTKDELLLLLKKNKALMIEEIQENFSISEVAIRKQLRNLENEKLVYKTKHKQEIGRPYYSYSLTEKGHALFPNRYEDLPVELLQSLEELQGSEVVNELLDKQMEKQGEAISNEITAVDFDEKIKELVTYQNKTGYMLEVEKTDSGDYILTNFNCPIANLASEYRQVCNSEKNIYRKIFQKSEVESGNYIANGSHVCKWVIKAPVN